MIDFLAMAVSHDRIADTLSACHEAELPTPEPDDLARVHREAARGFRAAAAACRRAEHERTIVGPLPNRTPPKPFDGSTREPFMRDMPDRVPAPLPPGVVRGPWPGVPAR